MRRWLSPSCIVSALSGAAIVAELGEGSGARKTTVVAPNRSSSPSAIRRRPGDPLAIQEGAVAREPVVGDRPFAADALDLGVQPGDLLVLVEADVDLGAAADGDPLAALLEREDPLAVRRPPEQERQAEALGLEPRGELGRRGRVGCRRAVHPGAS